MAIPLVVPIIIPVPIENKKECILVENKKYCEQEDLSKHDLGIFCIIIIFFFLWMFGVFFLLHEGSGILGVLLFFSPFIVGAILSLCT